MSNWVARKAAAARIDKQFSLLALALAAHTLKEISMEKFRKLREVLFSLGGLVILVQAIYVLSLVPQCMKKRDSSPRPVLCPPQVVNTIVACNCCKAEASCSAHEKQPAPTPVVTKKKATPIKRSYQAEPVQKITITIKDESGKIIPDVQIDENGNIIPASATSATQSTTKQFPTELKTDPNETAPMKPDVDVKKLYVGDKQQ